MLARWLTPPTNSAVNDLLPPESVLPGMLHVATPLPLSETPLQPASVVDPSLKVTVPLGVPPAGSTEVTVAVRRTASGTNTGLDGAPCSVVVVP